MQARYDPVTGLILTLPVYEGEFSIKLMQMIVRELRATEQDPTQFVDVISTILIAKQRVQ